MQQHQPPLEALKLLISLWMTEGIGHGDFEPYVMDLIDIRRAYFHAYATREVYVELPAEDHEEGMCGKLYKSMYGTRDAAQNWQAGYTEFMKAIGFTIGMSSPCIFHHKDRDIRAVVRGDDFTMLGSRQSLDWLKGKTMDDFEIKHKGRMGERDSDIKSVRILNRIVSWFPDGIECESDQRHAEIIIKQMGYLQIANQL